MTKILLFISFIGLSLTMAPDAQAQYRTSSGRRHYDSGRQQGGNGYHNENESLMELSIGANALCNFSTYAYVTSYSVQNGTSVQSGQTGNTNNIAPNRNLYPGATVFGDFRYSFRRAYIGAHLGVQYVTRGHVYDESTNSAIWGGPRLNMDETLLEFPFAFQIGPRFGDFGIILQTHFTYGKVLSATMHLNGKEEDAFNFESAGIAVSKYVLIAGFGIGAEYNIGSGRIQLISGFETSHNPVITSVSGDPFDYIVHNNFFVSLGFVVPIISVNVKPLPIMPWWRPSWL